MVGKQFLAVAMLGLLFTACQSDAAKTETKQCMYSYDKGQSTLEWTAYKFTNNTPVKGTFTEINISTLSEAASVEELVGSIGFVIPIRSLETQDELKNNNIITGFFQTMNMEVLKGQVVSVKGDQLTFNVELNGIKEMVSGSYEMNGDVFSFHGKMNLNLFNAGSAIAALNTKCGDNHKGEDGVVTVSDTVDIHFTTRLIKSCN